VVLVLAVSDEVDNALYADVGAVREARLIVACGDLPFDYLGYLMNALDVPLVFVPGNHDPDVSGYRTSRAGLTLQAGLPARPPWPAGAVNADRAVVDVADLRVAGLGGSPRYRDGPNQYTPREQARRARSLARRARWRKLRDGRGVDVLLTHAPPRGTGDRDRWAAPATAPAARAHPPRRRADHGPPARAHDRAQRGRAPSAGHRAGRRRAAIPHWCPPCRLIPGSRGRTSRTTSCASGAAR
jgi:hypothetical protein